MSDSSTTGSICIVESEEEYYKSWKFSRSTRCHRSVQISATCEHNLVKKNEDSVWIPSLRGKLYSTCTSPQLCSILSESDETEDFEWMNTTHCLMDSSKKKKKRWFEDLEEVSDGNATTRNRSITVRLPRRNSNVIPIVTADRNKTFVQRKTTKSSAKFDIDIETASSSENSLEYETKTTHTVKRKKVMSPEIFSDDSTEENSDTTLVSDRKSKKKKKKKKVESSDSNATVEDNSGEGTSGSHRKFTNKNVGKRRKSPSKHCKKQIYEDDEVEIISASSSEDEKDVFGDSEMIFSQVIRKDKISKKSNDSDFDSDETVKSTDSIPVEQKKKPLAKIPSLHLEMSDDEDSADQRSTCMKQDNEKLTSDNSSSVINQNNISVSNSSTNLTSASAEEDSTLILHDTSDLPSLCTPRRLREQSLCEKNSRLAKLDEYSTQDIEDKEFWSDQAASSDSDDDVPLDVLASQNSAITEKPKVTNDLEREIEDKIQFMASRPIYKNAKFIIKREDERCDTTDVSDMEAGLNQKEADLLKILDSSIKNNFTGGCVDEEGQISSDDEETAGTLYTQQDDFIYIDDSDDEDLSQKLSQQEVKLEFEDEKEEDWREILELSDSDSESMDLLRNEGLTDISSTSGIISDDDTSLPELPGSRLDQQAVDTDEGYFAETQIDNSCVKDEDDDDPYNADTQTGTFTTDDDDDYEIYQGETQVDIQNTEKKTRVDIYNIQGENCDKTRLSSSKKADKGGLDVVQERKDSTYRADDDEEEAYNAETQMITERSSSDDDCYIMETQTDTVDRLSDPSKLIKMDKDTFCLTVEPKHRSSVSYIDKKGKAYKEETTKQDIDSDDEFFMAATQIDHSPDKDVASETQVDSPRKNSRVEVSTSDKYTAETQHPNSDVWSDDELYMLDTQFDLPKRTDSSEDKMITLPSDSFSEDERCQMQVDSAKTRKSSNDEKYSAQTQMDITEAKESSDDEKYSAQTQMDFTKAEEESDEEKYLAATQVDVAESDEWSDDEIYLAQTQVDSSKSANEMLSPTAQDESVGSSDSDAFLSLEHKKDIPTERTDEMHDHSSGKGRNFIQDSQSKTWFSSASMVTRPEISLSSSSVRDQSTSKPMEKVKSPSSSYTPTMLKMAMPSSARPAIPIAPQHQKSSKEKREGFKITNFYSKKQTTDSNVNKSEPLTVTRDSNSWLSKDKGAQRSGIKRNRQPSGGGHPKRKKAATGPTLDDNSVLNAKALMLARQIVTKNNLVSKTVRKPSVEVKHDNNEDVRMPTMKEIREKGLPMMTIQTTKAQFPSPITAQQGKQSSKGDNSQSVSETKTFSEESDSSSKKSTTSDSFSSNRKSNIESIGEKSISSESHYSSHDSSKHSGVRDSKSSSKTSHRSVNSSSSDSRSSTQKSHNVTSGSGSSSDSRGSTHKSHSGTSGKGSSSDSRGSTHKSHSGTSGKCSSSDSRGSTHRTHRSTSGSGSSTESRGSVHKSHSGSSDRSSTSSHSKRPENKLDSYSGKSFKASRSSTSKDPKESSHHSSRSSSDSRSYTEDAGSNDSSKLRTNDFKSSGIKSNDSCKASVSKGKSERHSRSSDEQSKSKHSESSYRSHDSLKDNERSSQSSDSKGLLHKESRSSSSSKSKRSSDSKSRSGDSISSSDKVQSISRDKSRPSFSKMSVEDSHKSSGSKHSHESSRKSSCHSSSRSRSSTSEKHSQSVPKEGKSVETSHSNLPKSEKINEKKINSNSERSTSNHYLQSGTPKSNEKSDLKYGANDEKNKPDSKSQVSGSSCENVKEAIQSTSSEVIEETNCIGDIYHVDEEVEIASRKLANAAKKEKMIRSSQEVPENCEVEDNFECDDIPLSQPPSAAITTKSILKKSYQTFFSDKNDESQRKGTRIRFRLPPPWRISVSRTQQYINSLLAKKQTNPNNDNTTVLDSSIKTRSWKEQTPSVSSYQKYVQSHSVMIQDNSSGRVPLRAIANNNFNQPTIKAGTSNGVLSEHQDIFLASLLKWSGNWFDEAGAKCKANKYDPPPEVSSEVYLIPEVFETYKDYINIFTPHLLQEAWEKAFQSWRMTPKPRPQIPAVFSQAVECNKEKIGKFMWYSLISKENFESWRNEKLCEGSLVIIKDYGHYLKSKERPLKDNYYQANYWDQLGYIEKVQPYTQKHHRDQTIQAFPALASESVARQKDCVVIRLTLITRKRLFQHLLNKVSYIQPVVSLVTVMRQNDAMVKLFRSPLRDHVLMPGEQSVFSDDAVLTERDKVLLESYNPSQQKAICVLSSMILQSPVQPKVGLLQGPPGTGKSHTIIGLIDRLFKMYGQQLRVCLCAPSNNAVDLLVKRLIEYRNKGLQESFFVVRIGKPETMSADVKAHSLTEILKKNVKQLKAKKRWENIPESVKTNYYQLKQRIVSMKENLEKMSGKQKERLVADIFKEEGRLKEIEKNYCSSNDNSGISWQEEIRLKQQILTTCTVLCGTLSALGSHSIIDILMSRRQNMQPVFNCVIVDEASQANELDCIIPLQFRVNKFVLVGDPEQLPPTVQSKKAANKGFGQSLFERLHRHFHHSSSNPILMLDTQYRMHPMIAYWPCQYIYNGQLQTDRSVIERCRHSVVKPFVFFDVADSHEDLSQTTGSVSNMTEVDFITRLILLILKTSTLQFQPNDIGVIAPYKNQKNLLLNKLQQHGVSNIECSTVDGFQGREKTIIIFSCVRAKSQSGSIGFIADRKRMNVALTRAKSAMYIVAHLDSLQEADEDWKNLISDARRRHLVHRVAHRRDFEEAVASILINKDKT